MPWNKEDRSFKTLINRETTDSSNKNFFNEFGADTINVHADDIWADTIPDNDPALAVAQGMADLETLFVLTEDLSVPNSQSWKAGITDWISPKYGADFEVKLFDGSNSEIFTTDPLNWFFDYQTGILTFNGTLSYSTPLKITGYRYVGDKGIPGAGDISGGEAVTFEPYARESNEILYIDDEGDLSMPGRWSNGNSVVIKPFGTADTLAADTEGWVAPTAASGIVKLRILNTRIAEANSAGLEITNVFGAEIGEAYGSYSFDTIDGADADAWLWTGYDGTVYTGLGAAVGGRWSWDDNETTSSDTGPQSGAGGDPDGYVYIESSSPTGLDDEFYIELEDEGSPGSPKSFVTGVANLTFKTCQAGTDNNATIDVEKNEDGGGWVSVFSAGGPSDPEKISYGTNNWVQRQVNLTLGGTTNRIRIRVTMPSSGTVFYNDYALDDIELLYAATT